MCQSADKRLIKDRLRPSVSSNEYSFIVAVGRYTIGLLLQVDFAVLAGKASFMAVFNQPFKTVLACLAKQNSFWPLMRPNQSYAFTISTTDQAVKQAVGHQSFCAQTNNSESNRCKI